MIDCAQSIRYPLHVGCGPVHLAKFINIDLTPGTSTNPQAIVLAHDCTTRFPFSDNSVPAIFSEHFLENLDEADGLALLRETFRVLLPGGTLRVTVPTMDGILRFLTCTEDDPKLQRAYSHYGRMARVSLVNRIMLGEALSGLKFATGAVSHSEGHRFYYTTQHLRDCLAAIGFQDIEEAVPGRTRSAFLANVDTRTPMADVILEATKPPASVSSFGALRMAISLATYYRPGGTTPSKLRRALKAVRDQVDAPPWHIYIVGDCYDSDDELSCIVQEELPAGSFTLFNLHEPGERGKVPPCELHGNAGATAMNCTLDLALAAGFTWVARLDDDDEWSMDHLYHLSRGILAYPDAVLVHTQSQFQHRLKFPWCEVSEITRGGLPTLRCNVIHASVALNVPKLGRLRYKTRGPEWADAAMWRAIENTFSTLAEVHVPAQTVWHLSELGTSEIQKVDRLIFPDRALEPPSPDTRDSSVALVRFGGETSHIEFFLCLQKWLPKLIPGGVVQFRVPPHVDVAGLSPYVELSESAKEYDLRTPGFAHVRNTDAALSFVCSQHAAAMLSLSEA